VLADQTVTNSVKGLDDLDLITLLAIKKCDNFGHRFGLAAEITTPEKQAGLDLALRDA
jgi:hypothetical protein